MGSLAYVQQVTKIVVAQITQTIGWNAIQSTPLELLSDILHKYLEELTRQTQRYAAHYGRTEVNLDDVALAFRDLNIQLPDLEEYIVNVDPVPCAVHAPKFPIPKESNLNFLKPGSKEVVTRPVHIHEHLPAINPLDGDDDDAEKYKRQNGIEENGTSSLPTLFDTEIESNKIDVNRNQQTSNHIKPEDIHMVDVNDEENTINIVADEAIIESSENVEVVNNNGPFKKPTDAQIKPLTNQTHENGKSGRAIRELVSCIMTTSGFISPAREGKLPEAKRPAIIVEEEPPALQPKQIDSKADHPEKKHNSNRNDVVTRGETKVDPSNASLTINATKIKEKLSTATPLTEADLTALKKKLKHGQLDPATLKELKKAKKQGQLAAIIGKNRKLLKLINKLLVKPKKGGQGNNSTAPPTGGNEGNRPNDGNVSSSAMPNSRNLSPKKVNQSMKRKHLKALQKHIIGMDTETPKKKKAKHDAFDPSSLNTSTPSASVNLSVRSSHGGDWSNEAQVQPTINPVRLNLSTHEQSHDFTNRIESNPLDKLSSEPDKRKLNIFKKISSTASSNQNIFDPHSSLMGHKQLSSHEIHLPTTPDVKQSMTHGESNMMTSTPLPIEGKKSKLKTKLPKIPKEKKLKKDGSPRKQRTLKEPKGIPPMIVPLPSMQIFPNIGFLDHGFSGPGLIPTNPLIPNSSFGLPNPADTMANNPFAAMPNFPDFANYRFKRQHYGEASTVRGISDVSRRENASQIVSNKNERNINEIVKPLCHVAPFMPPSLLEKDHFAHKSSSMDTNPIDSYQLESVQLSKKSTTISLDHFESPSKHESSHHLQQQVTSMATSSTHLHSSTLDSKTIVIDSEDDEDVSNRFTLNDSLERSDSYSMNQPDQSTQSTTGTGMDSHEIKKEKKKIKEKNSSKKEKRDKDASGIKLKKKKKDKSKNKGENPDKAALKEEKRRKKREKGRLAAEAALRTSGSEPHARTYEGIVDSAPFAATSSDVSAVPEITAIPKLTLKLAPSSSSPSPRPPTPDPTLKKSSKSWKKKNKWRPHDDNSDRSNSDGEDTVGNYSKRDSSPEIARISALVTRPPKQKTKDSPTSKEHGDHMDRSEFNISTLSATQSMPTHQGRGRPKGSTNSKNKNKSVKIASLAEPEHHASMDLQATMSAGTNVLLTSDQQAHEDNQVWICPACGRVDDGTPMIGCDGCDAWYHWVCVGIQVPPDQDQDWYCRVCISKKQEIDKKKKRKKKDKKEH